MTRAIGGLKLHLANAFSSLMEVLFLSKSLMQILLAIFPVVMRIFYIAVCSFLLQLLPYSNPINKVLKLIDADLWTELGRRKFANYGYASTLVYR